MKRVFVDTGGFVALLVAEDQMHPHAASLFDSAARDRWTLLTTNAVVVETYSVLLARAKDRRRTALSFLDAVTEDQSQGLAVERVRPDDELNAITLRQDVLFMRCPELCRDGTTWNHRGDRI